MNLLLLLLIPYTAHAHRFLLDQDVIEFSQKDTRELPGVFHPQMTIEVNNERFQLPSTEDTRTYFTENPQGDAVMFSKDGHGALIRKNKFYNIGEKGVLSPLDLTNLNMIDPEEELNPLGHKRPQQPLDSRLTQFDEEKVI